MDKRIGYVALFLVGTLVGVTLFTNVIPIGLVTEFDEPTLTVHSDDPNTTYQITEWESTTYMGDNTIRERMYIQPADERDATRVYPGISVSYQTQDGNIQYDRGVVQESSNDLRQTTNGRLSSLNTSEFVEIRNHWYTYALSGFGGYVTTDNSSVEPNLTANYFDTYIRVTQKANHVSVLAPLEVNSYTAQEYDSDWTVNRLTIHDGRPALVYTNIDSIRPLEYTEFTSQIGGGSVVLNSNRDGRTVGITAEKSGKTPEGVFNSMSETKLAQVQLIAPPHQINYGIDEDIELLNKTSIQTDETQVHVTSVSGEDITSEDEYEIVSTTKPIGSIIPDGVSSKSREGFVSIWNGLDTETLLPVENGTQSSASTTLSLRSRSYITYYDRQNDSVAIAGDGYRDAVNITVSYKQNGQQENLTTQNFSRESRLEIIELPCTSETCQYQNVTIQLHREDVRNQTVPVERQPKLHKFVRVDVSEGEMVHESYREYLGGYRFSEYEDINIVTPDNETLYHGS